jgi:cyclopropane-fatty-acyl-phospholipid synthase
VTAAGALRPFVEAVVGPASGLGVRFWDGSTLAADGADAVAVFHTPDALRRILYAPGELGFARAYAWGEVDIEGDLFAALRVLARAAPNLAVGWRAWAQTARSAMALGVVGRPLAPPPEEARLRGRRHSLGRDRAAIAHHYDLSNEFYELLPGSPIRTGRSRRPRRPSTSWCAPSSASGPGCGCSTSDADGAAWSCTRPDTTASTRSG